MRDAVLLLVLLGSLVDYLVLAAGPALAPGVAGSLIPGLGGDAANALAALAPAGAFITSAVIWRSYGTVRRFSLALFATAVIGSLASGNGLYMLGAAFIALAGVLTLFVRPRRP